MFNVGIIWMWMSLLRVWVVEIFIVVISVKQVPSMWNKEFAWVIASSIVTIGGVVQTRTQLTQ